MMQRGIFKKKLADTIRENLRSKVKEEMEDAAAKEAE